MKMKKRFTVKQVLEKLDEGMLCLTSVSMSVWELSSFKVLYDPCQIPCYGRYILMVKNKLVRDSVNCILWKIHPYGRKINLSNLRMFLGSVFAFVVCLSVCLLAR